MQNPSLALIIPNYNDSRHIVTCLFTLLNQTTLPDEIIVVDDCSTDNSIEIIESIIAKHPKIHLIKNQKNLGVYGAIDVGAKYVTSEYIMFLSANDFVFPGIFAHAKANLKANPGVGLWSAMGWIVDDKNIPIKPLGLAIPALHDSYIPPNDCIKLANRLGNWFAGPSIIYHKKTFESVERFNPKYKGLADLVCALMVASKKGAVFTPVPYVVFRQHEGSYLSSTFQDPDKLKLLLKGLTENCAKISPELFNQKFSNRTINRFIFTAIKQSRGSQLNSYEQILDKNSAKLLAVTDKILSSKLSIIRIFISFIILRPFDILPFFWNRFLGTNIIAIKEGQKIKSALVKLNKKYLTQ